MTHNIVVHDAQVLTADAYAALQADKVSVAEAQSEAAQILAAAEAQAADIIANAEVRAQEIEAEMARVANESLEKFVDTNAIDKVAAAVRQTLDEAQKVRDDFDAFQPWMRDFVLATVERITQEYPSDALWEGILTQSLMDIKDRWNIVLRCNAVHASFFNTLIKGSHALGDHISAVEIDRDLDTEEVHLVSANGVVDVSIATQVATVIRVFEEAAE